MSQTTKPAGVAPYQKTHNRYIADMLCELFAARNIPYHRAEKTAARPVANDHPDDDYGYEQVTTYYIDTTPAVAAKLRAAQAAARVQPSTDWAAVADQLRAVYAAALDS